MQAVEYGRRDQPKTSPAKPFNQSQARVRLDAVPERVDWKAFGAGLDLWQGDGFETPQVDADIDAVAASGPIVVNMPEQLERTVT